jgi:hypothetical protein
VVKAAGIFAIATVAMVASAPAVLAQGCDLSGSPSSTLRNPLIWGAPTAQPFQQAPLGQPPAVGDGSRPAPVNPGMMCAPTLVPTQNWSVPNINGGSYQVPFSPTTEAPAGVLGPSLYAPPPPSTPGYDPGIIQNKRDFYPPPARVGSVMPGGGIAGGASYQRWGGQTTADFGRYKYEGKRAYDFGQGMYGQTSEDGPCQTRPGSSVTQDLYGRRLRGSMGGSNVQTIAPY